MRFRWFTDSSKGKGEGGRGKGRRKGQASWGEERVWEGDKYLSRLCKVV